MVTAENVYEGETIVLASGYESRSIAASVGIDIPMRKELIEALVTEAEPKMFPQMLGTADADYDYFKYHCSVHLPGNYEIHSKTCRCKDRPYLGRI